jgi:flavin-dependent dehydrogenase
VETGHVDSDVIVIGGGPAGSAAAITAASMGLRVRLLESRAVLGDHPGETLHPGVGSVLEQLGVSGRLASVTGARHAGIRIEWAGRSRFEPYGSDENGPWLGYQVSRARFDTMLSDRARELGVECLFSCTAHSLLREHGKTVGVRTSLGDMTGSQIIDASGRTPFPAPEPGRVRTVHSPSLIARYGYGTGSLPELDEAPVMRGDASGWQWTAMVRPGVYHWTYVSLDGTKLPRDWRPAEFQGLTPVGSPRGADVTWRLSGNLAAPGWFQVGDAAAVLDPTSANGILRGLLSGIIAAKLSYSVVSGSSSAAEAAAHYAAWFNGWFYESARNLSRFYSELGVQGFADESQPGHVRGASPS